MPLPTQLAQHFRQVCFGGNWTASSLKQHLTDVPYEQATARVGSLNTIAALTYHINYYVRAITRVLQGGPLDAHDQFSFDLPPIESEADWQQVLDALWADAETLAGLMERVPEAQLSETFVLEKYGTYLRNFLGLIEHTHYHLGQIVVIKKLLSPVQPD